MGEIVDWEDKGVREDNDFDNTELSANRSCVTCLYGTEYSSGMDVSEHCTEISALDEVKLHCDNWVKDTEVHTRSFNEFLNK